ncbi:MAG: P1 family peptidase [Anaerolineales bacterium]|nr:P1 family peptidase [Anaerolineales bacterium]
MMSGKKRARELGIQLPGVTGALNAITDVAGVLVGQETIIRGDGGLVVGQGPVRTGVTVVLPTGFSTNKVMAGYAVLNGNGEMTGTIWVEESGFLDGPVAITNTHAVGTVHQAVIEWQRDNLAPSAEAAWSLPVVGETYDGVLNDINGFHVQKEHVFKALASAKSGPVAEGCVGGGTGMICYSFKGGIGTASRLIEIEGETYTVGVLVQANFGRRHQLMVGGLPVGLEMTDKMPEIHSWGEAPAGSSIIVVVATDAPLLPHQLKRVARRAGLGIARTGGVGSDSSGDIFIAFSTANAEAGRAQTMASANFLPNPHNTPIFEATAQATEEAILNAVMAAETMVGINGNTVHALPQDELRAILQKYNRLAA